jgi:hypothetical protein
MFEEGRMKSPPLAGEEFKAFMRAPSEPFLETIAIALDMHTLRYASSIPLTTDLAAYGVNVPYAGDR